MAALTLADVPAQMTEPVQGVEREWCSKNGLACILDAFWENGNGLDDVCGAERFRRSKVREGVGVQHCGNPSKTGKING